MDTKKYNELKHILNTELFLGRPISGDMGEKLGLIAMVCYLTHALKQKKPGITHYEVIRLCTKNVSTDDFSVETLALICEWFANSCTKFPDLGIKAKEMPTKICETFKNLLPF